MPTFFLGIDIAKKTFDVALITPEMKPLSRPRHKSFDNNPQGFEQLSQWLTQNGTLTAASPGSLSLHACLEATGVYGDALARYLVAAGHRVSVVNPSILRAFARTELSRTKTDKADAMRIARYCQMHQPAVWTPPSEEIATLQALARRLESLQQMHQMEKLRQQTASPAVTPSLDAVVTVLEQQIALVEQQIRNHIDQHPDLRKQRDLLQSIPGIGFITAALRLCEMGDWSRFPSARSAAAYVGLVPRLHESGTSVRARSPLCKIGNGRLRKALYFPAMTALRFNPVLRAMSARLSALGKSKMAILGAAMRRLVHLAYGVLKSAKPFDATIALRQQMQQQGPKQQNA